MSCMAEENRAEKISRGVNTPCNRGFFFIFNMTLTCRLVESLGLKHRSYAHKSS